MTKEERDAWFKEMAAAEAEALKVSSFLAGNPNAKMSLSDRIKEELSGAGKTDTDTETSK